MGEKCIQGFGEKNLRESDLLEDKGGNKRTLLKWIFRKWDGAWAGLIYVAQKTDGWRALVNAVINLRVP
jgi:hypothetical protein